MKIRKMLESKLDDVKQQLPPGYVNEPTVMLEEVPSTECGGS